MFSLPRTVNDAPSILPNPIHKYAGILEQTKKENEELEKRSKLLYTVIQCDNLLYTVIQSSKCRRVFLLLYASTTCVYVTLSIIFLSATFTTSPFQTSLPLMYHRVYGLYAYFALRAYTLVPRKNNKSSYRKQNTLPPFPQDAQDVECLPMHN